MPVRVLMVVTLLCARGAGAADVGVTVATSGGLSPQWDQRTYDPQDLWAYKPVKAATVDATANPVDAFIRQTLKDRGIQQLAPPAERRELIRRLTFDLTALPPTPEEVDAFVKDDSPAAYGHLVDRLLASPDYGEQ